jgi:hypothetical protein
VRRRLRTFGRCRNAYADARCPHRRQLLSRTLASLPKRFDPRLINTMLCQRAHASSYLGATEAAMRDVAQALAASRGNPTTTSRGLRVRATVERNADSAQAAITDMLNTSARQREVSFALTTYAEEVRMGGKVVAVEPIPPSNMRMGLVASEATRTAWAYPNDRPVEAYGHL